MTHDLTLGQQGSLHKFLCPKQNENACPLFKTGKGAVKRYCIKFSLSFPVAFLTCHGVFSLPFEVTILWSGDTPHTHPKTLSFPPQIPHLTPPHPTQATGGPRKDCNICAKKCSVPGLEVGKRPVPRESPSKHLWCYQPWVRTATAQPCRKGSVWGGEEWAGPQVPGDRKQAAKEMRSWLPGGGS